MLFSFAQRHTDKQSEEGEKRARSLLGAPGFTRKTGRPREALGYPLPRKAQTAPFSGFPDHLMESASSTQIRMLLRLKGGTIRNCSGTAVVYLDCPGPSGHAVTVPSPSIILHFKGTCYEVGTPPPQSLTQDLDEGFLPVPLAEVI